MDGVYMMRRSVTFMNEESDMVIVATESIEPGVYYVAVERPCEQVAPMFLSTQEDMLSRYGVDIKKGLSEKYGKPKYVRM